MIDICYNSTLNCNFDTFKRSFTKKFLIKSSILFTYIQKQNYSHCSYKYLECRNWFENSNNPLLKLF